MPKLVQLDTTQLSDEQEQRVKDLGLLGLTDDAQRRREAVLVTVDLNAAIDCCMDDAIFGKQRALHVAEIEEARKAGMKRDGLRAAQPSAAASSSAASTSISVGSPVSGRAGKRPAGSSSGQPDSPQSRKQARPQPSTSKGKGKASSALPPRGSQEGATPHDWPGDGVTYTPFLLWGDDGKGGISDGDKLRLDYATCMPLAAARIQRLPADHPCVDPSDPGGAAAHGLFATRAVERGEVIGCYTGVVSPRTKESDDAIGSQYVMAVDRRATGLSRAELLIDAAKYGNETRYLNDYRSISADSAPNCRFETGRDAASGEVCVRVVVGRNVAEEGELLVDYGDGFWEAHEEEAVRNSLVVEVQIKPLCSSAFAVSVDRADYVCALKETIRKQRPEWRGIPGKFIELIHAGKVLSNDQTLADCNLGKASVIHLKEKAKPANETSATSSDHSDSDDGHGDE